MWDFLCIWYRRSNDICLLKVLVDVCDTLRLSVFYSVLCRVCSIERTDFCCTEHEQNVWGDWWPVCQTGEFSCRSCLVDSAWCVTCYCYIHLTVCNGFIGSHYVAELCFLTFLSAHLLTSLVDPGNPTIVNKLSYEHLDGSLGGRTVWSFDMCHIWVLLWRRCLVKKHSIDCTLPLP